MARRLSASPPSASWRSSLRVERRLVDGAGQVSHAIGLEPERVVERRRGHDLVEGGAVVTGDGIDGGGAGGFHGRHEAAAVMLAPGEHQVFDEMGEPAPARALVPGADSVPDGERHQRLPVVLADDDGEAVGQHEPAVGRVRCALQLHGGAVPLGERHEQSERQGERREDPDPHGSTGLANESRYASWSSAKDITSPYGVG
jgi:hypothetical protein